MRDPRIKSSFPDYDTHECPLEPNMMKQQIKVTFSDNDHSAYGAIVECVHCGKILKYACTQRWIDNEGNKRWRT